MQWISCVSFLPLPAKEDGTLFLIEVSVQAQCDSEASLFVIWSCWQSRIARDWNIEVQHRFVRPLVQTKLLSFHRVLLSNRCIFQSSSSSSSLELVLFFLLWVHSYQAYVLHPHVLMCHLGGACSLQICHAFFHQHFITSTLLDHFYYKMLRRSCLPHAPYFDEPKNGIRITSVRSFENANSRFCRDWVGDRKRL